MRASSWGCATSLLVASTDPRADLDRIAAAPATSASRPPAAGALRAVVPKAALDRLLTQRLHLPRAVTFLLDPVGPATITGRPAPTATDLDDRASRPALILPPRAAHRRTTTAMPVDPDLQRALDQLEEAGLNRLGGATPEAARAAFDAITLRRRGPDYEPEPVEEVADDELPGPAGPLPVRVYRPGGEPTVVIAYFHGGGFVIGSIETHDPVCRWMANALQAVVASVEYRLAPEHPFPAALDDGVAALAGIAERHPGPPLAVAGDSAGATLAIGTALRVRDEGGPDIAAALLWYPAADPSHSAPSVEENGEGHFLTKQDMAWFQEQYTPRQEDRRDPHVDLLRADLHGLPPTIIATAQYDPLRDDGIALAERLDRAGVEVQHVPGPGMIHGFVGFAPISPKASAHRAAVLQRFAALLSRVAPRT